MWTRDYNLLVLNKLTVKRELIYLWSVHRSLFCLSRGCMIFNFLVYTNGLICWRESNLRSGVLFPGGARYCNSAEGGTWVSLRLPTLAQQHYHVSPRKKSARSQYNKMKIFSSSANFANWRILLATTIYHQKNVWVKLMEHSLEMKKFVPELWSIWPLCSSMYILSLKWKLLSKPARSILRKKKIR